MSKLIKWNKEVPSDFYRMISHLWVQHADGTVETCPKIHYDQIHDGLEGEVCHADKWGEEVMDNPNRGYYAQELGLITCHAYLEPSTANKLTRKFQDAMYHT